MYSVLWRCGVLHESIRVHCSLRYTFYDGPPFATGLPHYGHILAGTIKVSVCVLCACVCVCAHTCVCVYIYICVCV